MKHADSNELLDLLYGLETGREHVDSCASCQEQLAEMLAARKAIVLASAHAEPVPSALLRQQRQHVLEKLEGRRHPLFGPFQVQRWASAAVLVAALASGVAVYEGTQGGSLIGSKTGSEIADSQLAEDVSEVADSPEPFATGPLQALFADQ